MRRRWGALVGVIAAVVVGVAGVVLVARGGASNGDGGGVVLEPATVVSPGAFFDDLDLYPADDRALEASAAAEGFDAFAELDQPVALAGRLVRAFEPGLYSGTHDRPPCDVEVLAELVADGGQADAAAIDAWFTALGDDIRENQRGDYVDDLTPVRLRFDTRATSHRLENGEAVAYQALLQAGTAVLVDESGMLRVRCSGGHPLGEPEPSPDLDGDAAFDVDELAENPHDAWDGLDPARAVVVGASPAQDHFDLADPVDGSRFRRLAGSDGTRDQTLESEDDEQPQRCDEGCHSVEITAVSVAGSSVTIPVDAVVAPVPPQGTGTGVSWPAGSATTGTYTVVVRHDYELWRELTDEEEAALFEVPGLYEAIQDNPDLDTESVVLEMGTVVNGTYVPTRLMQCVPGEITVTFTVDQEVVETVNEHVPCDEDRAFEFTLE